MSTTPITNQAIQAAIVNAAKTALPIGSTVALTGAGRRDDSRIAAQVSYRFIAGNGKTVQHWATVVLDRMQVEAVYVAVTEAAADIDFMRAALANS